MKSSYLLIAETIFCDNESDPAVRNLYFSRWLHSLEWIAKLEIPEHVDFYLVMYISRDKVDETQAIYLFLKGLPESIQERFQLVLYDHPSEGYNLDSEKHPDSIKNPNKVAPRRDKLFERAWKQLPASNADRIIRATLDDDDFWLPWQLKEMVRIANIAFEENQIVGVGLRQACVSYLEERKTDVVEMTHHMNGNKFYVSSFLMIEKQRKLSPWSIPEDFNENNVARLARAGVKLKSTKANRPGWIYGRWGGNLSLHNKSNYYARRLFAFSFDDSKDSIFQAERRIANWFEQEPQDESVESMG